MSIQDIEDVKLLKEAFRNIGGRDGVSERAIELCKRVAESKCPRQAVFAIGRMATLFNVCKADSYWSEKSRMGKSLEKYSVIKAARDGGVFSGVDSCGDEKR